MKIISNLKNSFFKNKKKKRAASSRSDKEKLSFGSSTTTTTSDGSQTSVGSPKISRRELEVLLRRMPDPLTEEEVMDMLAEADRDGDGSIEWEDIQSLGSGFGSDPDEEMREAFKVFDSDGDGKISAEELMGLFVTMGDAGCGLEDCKGIIRVVDSDGDGFVCYQDFVRMMMMAFNS